jgi:hypothetical protein
MKRRLAAPAPLRSSMPKWVGRRAAASTPREPHGVDPEFARLG